MIIDQINPDVEVMSFDFDVLEAGNYDLKVVNVEQSETSNGNTKFTWTLEPIAPISELVNAEGEEVKKLGKIFYDTIMTEKAQWRLKALVEGAGLAYEPGLDTDELLNKEVRAYVTIKREYTDKNGAIVALKTPRNEVSKILK